MDGKYEPLEERVEGGLRLIRRPVLGLDLRAEGRLLRFRDPATGEDVRHRKESDAAAALNIAANAGALDALYPCSDGFGSVGAPMLQ